MPPRLSHAFMKKYTSITEHKDVRFTVPYLSVCKSTLYGMKGSFDSSTYNVHTGTKCHSTLNAFVTSFFFNILLPPQLNPWYAYGYQLCHDFMEQTVIVGQAKLSSIE
jgi:hypothetical protein